MTSRRNIRALAAAAGAVGLVLATVAPVHAVGVTGPLGLVPGSAAGQNEGIAVVTVGDLDGNGVPEIAVGADAALPSGAVRILFPDAAGNVLSSVVLSGADVGATAAGAHVGAALAAPGDVDGDGVPDLVVGAPGQDRGDVWIVTLQPGGLVKESRHVTVAGQPLGDALLGTPQLASAVAVLPSTTPGTLLLALGAPGDDLDGDDAGAVYTTTVTVATGDATAPVRLAGGPVPQEQDLRGSALAVLQQGPTTRLAVGSPQAGDGSTVPGDGVGAVDVLTLVGGVVTASARISQTTVPDLGLRPGDLFGSALAAASDLDGDGVLDLAVGAPGTDTVPPGDPAPPVLLDTGAVHLLTLAASGVVRGFARVDAGSSAVEGLPSLREDDQLGSSLSLLPGSPRMLSGVPGTGTNGGIRSLLLTVEQPVPVVPEVPLTLLLPLAAAGVALVVVRRRRSQTV